MGGLQTFPAGCLVTFGSLCLATIALGLLALVVLVPGYRESLTYTRVLDLVNRDPAVLRALGEPIRETGLISYISDVNAGRGGTRRLLSVRVAGPKGEATLFAEGFETQGNVRLETVRLTLANGQRLQLQGQ